MKRKNSDEPSRLAEWIRGIFWNDFHGEPSFFIVMLGISIIIFVFGYFIVSSKPTTQEKYEQFYSTCIALETTTHDECHERALNWALGG